MAGRIGPKVPKALARRRIKELKKDIKGKASKKKRSK